MKTRSFRSNPLGGAPLRLALSGLPQGPTRARLDLDAKGPEIAVWKPSTPAPPDGFPVVIFSHGFHGNNRQSGFLMRALAGAGYVVLAPNHRDALKISLSGLGPPETPFRRAADWNDTTYRDRADDIRGILNLVEKTESILGLRVDGQHIGLAGHSLGGYTVLGLTGAWPSWKDPRVKAVLALSPYCSPFVAQGGLPRVIAPIMFHGGTRDFAVTPTVARPGGAYDLAPAPKYYVEFERAGHFAWTDLNRRHSAGIARYAVAFFDRYLKSGSAALDTLMAGPFPGGIRALRADLR